ncbi:hypothetical protein [Streptacidiphilus sp. P02-A3a]|uniref:hypothetical protein n=1 Tax=Streptacidiphilus sp. P02-A3a TaxID=2704468 RepID=UPI0015FDEE88|nr:hypothetical protein [Streptacidiphilus sp. P02-A3a]QMU67768.1 hypothetical protein GXP74_05510 [Streptacidiphilus sp. P02-A3a]
MKTTMIKTIGLTGSAATRPGASAVVLPVSGLVGRHGFGGFDGSDLAVADLSLAGGGSLAAIRDERPMSASVAAAAANLGFGYAAAGAGNHRAGTKQSEQQHTMWAFRGPGPWKQPT